MKGNIGWSAWKQRYCKQCYQNKERRNNPSTLIFFLLEIIDFFLLPKKQGSRLNNRINHLEEEIYCDNVSFVNYIMSLFLKDEFEIA